MVNCEKCNYWSATENEKPCCQYKAKGPDDSLPCGLSYCAQAEMDALVEMLNVSKIFLIHEI